MAVATVAGGSGEFSHDVADVVGSVEHEDPDAASVEVSAQLTGDAGGAKRRRWEEMDALRARMVREGYDLDDLNARDRERVWRTLAGGTRQAELLQLLGVSEGELRALIGRLRAERLELTGRR